MIGSSSKGPEPVTLEPLINLVPAKKDISCEPPAYLEFPPDIFGQFLRKHGFVLVHLVVVCYMFYCLAVVCDNYFLPSLEQCAQVRRPRKRDSSSSTGPRDLEISLEKPDS